MPSSPLSATSVSKPAFSSIFWNKCSSVGESSMMRTTAILCPSVDLVGNRTQQFIFRERLGEVLFGTHDAASRTIKQAVFRRQHDHGGLPKGLVVLDKRTGLIAVEARHHDVHKNQVRLVIGYFGQRIETINRRKNLAPLFGQQGFCGSANGFAVVYYEYLEP